MSVCCELLGWGDSDVEALENIIEKYRLRVGEVSIKTEYIFGEVFPEIHNYIYSALYLASIAPLETSPEYKNNIYTDCLDRDSDSCFCCELLGWGDLDVEALENIMEEYRLRVGEVSVKREHMFGEVFPEINNYIYSALYLASIKIKEALLETYPEYKNIINDYKENIYTDYLDRGFDSCFGNYNYRDLVGDERDKYLFNLMNEVLEESGKNKMEKGETNEFML